MTSTRRDAGGRAPIPLPERQVRHLVPLGRQPLGHPAVPALGAADGVREEAVVDEADAHGAQPITSAADTCPVHTMSIVEPLLFPEPEVLSPEDELLVSVVIPCLNEAANIERCVTWARTTHGRARHPRRGRGGRQRLRGRVRRARARRRRPPRLRAPPRLRQRLHGRLRRRQGPLHRHGRRRPDLRLRRDPALPRGAGERRRPRHGRPHGRHPARRHAVAAPLHRQPDPLRHAEPLLQDRRARRPLRHARLPPRPAARARPPHHRHGVRLRDGDPRRQGGPGHPPAADRLPPARRHLQALELPRRLAPPALPARPLADAPVRDPRRRDAAARRARSRSSRSPASSCSAASGSCTR